jgi:hypothetical protein
MNSYKFPSLYYVDAQPELLNDSLVGKLSNVTSKNIRLKTQVTGNCATCKDFCNNPSQGASQGEFNYAISKGTVNQFQRGSAYWGKQIFPLTVVLRGDY